MAVTQYIGARYVPIFYTNPNDNSNNWLAGVEYEPLTIVTDLNQSYASKKPVPAAIGRPSDNPDYWILTGAYNAQVEQYRQEVEGVIDDVTDLTNFVNTISDDNVLKQNWLAGKNIYVVGDSLSRVQNNMWEQLEKIVPNVSITNAAEGGIALARMVQIVEAADLSSYDVIFVQCCTNDWQGSMPYAQFTTTLGTMISTIRSKKANIEIIFVTPPYSHRNFDGVTEVNKNAAGLYLFDYVNIVLNTCSVNNISVIDVYDYSNCNSANYTAWLDISPGTQIYVHPNTRLSEVIAELIATRVTAPMVRDKLNCTITKESYVTAAPAITYNRKLQCIDINYLQFTYTGASVTAGTLVDIATIDSIPFGGMVPGNEWLPAFNYTKGNTVLILVDFSNKVMKLRPMEVSLDASNVLVFPGKSIYL